LRRVPLAIPCQCSGREDTGSGLPVAPGPAHPGRQGCAIGSIHFPVAHPNPAALRLSGLGAPEPIDCCRVRREPTARGTAGSVLMADSPDLAPAAPPPSKPERLASIDAYRGLVMFLLMAETLSLCRVGRNFPGSRLWELLCYHQSHVEW